MKEIEGKNQEASPVPCFTQKRPPFKAAFRHFKLPMKPKMTLILDKVMLSSICDETQRDAHLLPRIPEFLQVFFSCCPKS